MSPARRSGWPAIWFYAAVVVSVLLIVATALRFVGPDAFPLPVLQLSREKSIATWWSGMLLAMASLHAYDGHALLRPRAPAAGWALLAAVLLFLSFDEIGSIHERLSQLGQGLGLGTWTLLLPLAAVLAAMAGGALVLLWSAGGEQRRKVWPIGFGFLLLGSVAPQEFLEHNIEWRSDAARAVRSALEEGTEMFGILVLLRVAMTNTAGPAGAGGPAFTALHELRRPLTILGLAVAAALLAFATASLADRRQGHPADWFAAVAFLAAALVACERLFKGGGIDWRRWAPGSLCVLASIGVVVIRPDKLVWLGPLEVGLRMLALGAISLLASAAWLSFPGVAVRRACLAAAALGAATVLSALWSPNLMLVYTLSQLLGLAMFWISATLRQDTGR